MQVYRVFKIAANSIQYFSCISHWKLTILYYTLTYEISQLLLDLSGLWAADLVRSPLCSRSRDLSLPLPLHRIFSSPAPAPIPLIRFLSRVSILLLTRDIDIPILSVCPSVSDTLVLYENGSTYRHSFFHHTVAQAAANYFFLAG